METSSAQSGLVRLQTIASVGILTALSPIAAETLYWDGTDTSWSAAAGWSTVPGASTPNPLAAPGAGDDVVFNISTLGTTQTVGLGGANQAANSLTFTSTGTVTLGGGGARDLVIGAGGITMASGAGTVAIGTTSGSQNVYVRLGASQTWTNNSTSSLTSRNSTTGAATGTAPVTLTLSTTNTGGITNSGELNDGAEGAVVSLVVNSSGTGVANNAGGNYSGGTTILSGTLAVSGATPLGAGGGAVLLGATTGAASSTLNINSTSAVANNITVRAGSSGVKTIGSNTNSVLNGTLLLNDNLTISPSSNTTTINGIISGSGMLTKSGVGALALTGNNIYSGGTTLSASGGTLRINNGGTNASNSAIGTGTLTILGGALDNTSGSAVTLATNNAIDIGANFTFTGTNDLNLGNGAVTLNGSGSRIITVSGGTLTLGGVISNGTATGIIKQGGGTLRLSNTANTFTSGFSLGASGQAAGVVEVTKLANSGVASSIGTGSSITFGGTSTGTLRYIGSGDSTNRTLTIGGVGAIFDSSGTGSIKFTTTISPSYASAGTARSIIFTGSNTDDNTIVAAFSDSGVGQVSIVKQGAGRWILTGNNTYTGATSVNAGSLETGATGTFGAGNITVATGAFLTAGNASSFGDTATLFFFSNSTAGSISLSAGNDLLGAVYDSFGATFLAAGTYDAAALNNAFGTSVFTGLGTLTVAAIPEPSAYALLIGLGGLTFAGIRRRHSRRARSV